MSKKKFSNQLKLTISQEYMAGNDSYIGLAKKYHTNKSNVKKWVDAFKEHGVDGLTTTHGTYSGDFKVTAVEYMHSTGSSIRNTAAVFNIPSYFTVSKWERIYLEEGPATLYVERRGRKGNMKKGRPSKLKSEKQPEEDLIAEVQRLRMENEYLKKLNALVQEREKSAKKTR